MRTLELFAGTQSFSKGVMRSSPHNEVITVEKMEKLRPSVCADILTWDYTVFTPGYFDVIWCSPPCQAYSRAKTVGVRDLETADACVRRCFEIIDYLQPRTWILENPQTGLLAHRMDWIRHGLTSYDVDFCAYGKPYRKRTRLWSNRPFALRLCAGSQACPAMNEDRHIGSCGNTTARYNAFGSLTALQKGALPEPLIDEIVGQIGG